MPKFEIPQWALDSAIEDLQELTRRLEDDAAHLARVDSPEGRTLAQERLEQACEYRKAHEFYLHL